MGPRVNARAIIIECGAAQTRAALIVDEVVTRFWFGPARGDERREAAPQPGIQYLGRVTSVEKSRGALFVDIGARQAGFLQMGGNKAPPNEGALIRVEIKRAVRGCKGATLGFLGAAEAGAVIGPLAPPRDALLQALAYLGGAPADEIIVDSGAAKAFLDVNAENIGTITHEAGNLFAAHGGDEALDDVFLRTIPLPCGGTIVIDEAEAMTAIDVDQGAATRGDAKRIERINCEAARMAALQISRRDIGGQIVIDFLRDLRASPATLNNELKLCFPDAQKAGWTKSGLFAFVLPRPYASLLDRFTEEAPGEPVNGHRFTLDWLAKAGLSESENRLRSSATLSLKLGAGPVLFNFLTLRIHWTDRLNERYGARLNIVEDHKREDRAYDLSG